DVLRVEEAPIPVPGPGRIRVRVAACGLNPVDWVLCRGLFARDLPRGVGLDVAGVVDALGEGVADVRIGDPVFGPADYAGCASAGASDYAVLTHWAKVPPGLDMIQAASLTMAVETAFRGVDLLGVAAGQTFLVSGAGTMVGFAAAQMGLLRGARVIATAGETFAGRLRGLGAAVVPYGEGLAERVREIAGAPPDLVFDAAPVNLKLDHAPTDGVLADLVEIAGGDPRRVLTCVDFARAAALGVRTGQGEEVNADGTPRLRYDALGDFAKLAAEGRFSIPLARTFALEEWPEAFELSQSGRAHGKLVILLDAPATV
ncbi:MAG: NADP-dependent oxidoreductase, partial [Caulobacteraceae bacterium]